MLLFDLNDFDETPPGPFEYDVKRMAASFAIAGRNNGFGRADTRAATRASVMAYREAMAGFATVATMEVWYARLAGMAGKVVGVGSVGALAYIVLLQGRDQDDPLFLQLREATASVLEDHLPASGYRHHGQRVVSGQRMMQAASDICLGWTESPPTWANEIGSSGRSATSPSATPTRTSATTRRSSRRSGPGACRPSKASRGRCWILGVWIFR